jgi:hypothetical protein
LDEGARVISDRAEFQRPSASNVSTTFPGWHGYCENRKFEFSRSNDFKGLDVAKMSLLTTSRY